MEYSTRRSSYAPGSPAVPPLLQRSLVDTLPTAWASTGCVLCAMKVVGLLGGMSWESTLVYYRQMNLETNRRLGGLHSARILLNSVDFHQIEALQHADEWERLAGLLIHEAGRLQSAGAELLIICTNTMHKMADRLEAELDTPLLHIVDATGRQVNASDCRSVALLGTRFTMEQAFYRERLEQRFGIRVLIPEAKQRELIHKVIYQELCLGRIEQRSRAEYLRIIAEMVNRGADGVVLGCTEIPLLVSQQDIDVPLFDTTQIHVMAAVDAALEE